jgi:hypothetical protein
LRAYTGGEYAGLSTGFKTRECGGSGLVPTPTTHQPAGMRVATQARGDRVETGATRLGAYKASDAKSARRERSPRCRVMCAE